MAQGEVNVRRESSNSGMGRPPLQKWSHKHTHTFTEKERQTEKGQGATERRREGTINQTEKEREGWLVKRRTRAQMVMLMGSVSTQAV